MLLLHRARFGTTTTPLERSITDNGQRTARPLSASVFPSLVSVTVVSYCLLFASCRPPTFDRPVCLNLCVCIQSTHCLLFALQLAVTAPPSYPPLYCYSFTAARVSLLSSTSACPSLRLLRHSLHSLNRYCLASARAPPIVSLPPVAHYFPLESSFVASLLLQWLLRPRPARRW